MDINKIENVIAKPILFDTKMTRAILWQKDSTPTEQNRLDLLFFIPPPLVDFFQDGWDSYSFITRISTIDLGVFEAKMSRYLFTKMSDSMDGLSAYNRIFFDNYGNNVSIRHGVIMVRTFDLAMGADISDFEHMPFHWIRGAVDDMKYVFNEGCTPIFACEDCTKTNFLVEWTRKLMTEPYNVNEFAQVEPLYAKVFKYH